MELKFLKGLFSYRKKSIPTVPVEMSGFIINNKINHISDYSQYLLVDIDQDYSFATFFMAFSLLANLTFAPNMMFLICCRDQSYQYKLKYILDLLYINKYTFIDDYNFFKEDLINIYIDQPVMMQDNKLLYYNIHNNYKFDIELDLLDLYIKNVNKVSLNLNSMEVFFHSLVKNLNDTVIFNLDDTHILDPYKLKAIINKNQYNKIVIFTKNQKEYNEFCPNTIKYIDIEQTSNKTVFKNLDLLKFCLFLLCKDVVSNQDYKLLLLASVVAKKLEQHYKYKFLYSNDVDTNLLNKANELGLVKEYEFINAILTKPLNIAFITRVTRQENLLTIYENIKEITSKNYANYTWILILPSDKIFNFKYNDEFRKDKNIVIIDDYISFYKNDIYDSVLLNTSLMHKELLKCQFLYVLDDDNLVHPNLINIIRKHLDKYLIINRLELTEAQRYNSHILNFESPTDLHENFCLGKVDFANCVFNLNALKGIGGFNLTKGSAFSDGATVLSFLNAGIEIAYSNELGAYYNKLVKEN